MNVGIQFDSQAVADALRAYIKAMGKDVPTALREQGREVARKTMLFTPPQKGPAQGRAAVKRDIYRAVNPVDARTLKSPKLQKIARERNYGAMDVVMQRIAARSGFAGQFLPFSPELHQRARDSRGRVMREKRVNTFDVEEVRDYVKRKQENVGRAKGGWAASALGLGGTAPAYASRFASLGGLVDRASNPVHAYITMVNRSEWAKGGNAGDSNRVVRNALRSQVQAIYRKIEDAMEAAKRKAGL